MAKRKDDYEPCPFNKTNCFGINKQGECEILTDTKFKCKKCPFFKTSEQIEKENKGL